MNFTRLPIFAAAFALGALFRLPGRSGPSGTNNGKSHSSAAQRRSPHYQPTGDGRIALERAKTKRVLRQARNLRAAA